MQTVEGDNARWGDLEHLAASAVDELRVGNYLFASVHAKSKPKKPRLVQRPGVKPSDSKKKKFGTGARPIKEMRRMLDKWTGRGRR